MQRRTGEVQRYGYLAVTVVGIDFEVGIDTLHIGAVEIVFAEAIHYSIFNLEGAKLGVLDKTAHAVKVDTKGTTVIKVARPIDTEGRIIKLFGGITGTAMQYKQNTACQSGPKGNAVCQLQWTGEINPGQAFLDLKRTKLAQFLRQSIFKPLGAAAKKFNMNKPDSKAKMNGALYPLIKVKDKNFRFQDCFSWSILPNCWSCDRYV